MKRVKNTTRPLIRQRKQSDAHYVPLPRHYLLLFFFVVGSLAIVARRVNNPKTPQETKSITTKSPDTTSPVGPPVDTPVDDTDDFVDEKTPVAAKVLGTQYTQKTFMWIYIPFLCLVLLMVICMGTPGAAIFAEFASVYLSFVLVVDIIDDVLSANKKRSEHPYRTTMIFSVTFFVAAIINVIYFVILARRIQFDPKYRSIERRLGLLEVYFETKKSDLRDRLINEEMEAIVKGGTEEQKERMGLMARGDWLDVRLNKLKR